MAQFKLYLLTSNANNSSKYLKTLISDYSNKVSINNFTSKDARKNVQLTDNYLIHSDHYTYTYNEKISFHQNGQKDLTFDMNKNMLINDSWIQNPFIKNLHTGSTLLLEDKYGKTYVFIISQIKYVFTELNITYSYTCKDAFSYQYSRQNSGYTIENDVSSENFIGPKTIDWWVIKKIAPECFINYQYIPLTKGLYKTYDAENNINEYHFFTENERLKWNDEPKTILKEPFTNDDYQTTITFSCSNSNANAALIALGDELNLMIHTFEDIDSNGIIHYYFWYEPKQNQDVTGLIYSPKTQISNFDLTFNGNSLVTVLNVNSNEVGDELVTLFPTTPSFFTSYLMNEKEWEKTKFEPGFFTNLIKGKEFFYSPLNTNKNSNNISLAVEKDLFKRDDDSFVSIKLNLTKLPLMYDKFMLNWNRDQYTIFNYSIDRELVNFNSKTATPYLYIAYDEIVNDETVKNEYIIREEDKISHTLWNKELTIKLLIKVPFSTTKTEIKSYNINNFYLTFFRDFTEEEEEFAKIADECPWLENKLIDFSYFLQQGILSPAEYTQLMYTLQNDLRIVNGKLLYLSDTYFRAVKDKVKQIAKLTEQLDTLGATFQYEVVNTIEQNKNEVSVDNFKNAYDLVFNQKADSIPIINYTDLVNEYFNKYLDAEQRFLKNIYSFREYFNEPCLLADTGVYKYTITVGNATGNFVCCGEPVFEEWDKETVSGMVYYQYINSNYKIFTFVTEDNISDLYEPNIKAGDFTQITGVNNKIDYNSNNQYFLNEGTYINIFGSIKENTTTVTINNQTYCELSRLELTKLAIYSLMNKEGKQYYIRDRDSYTPFNNIRSNAAEIGSLISWKALPNVRKYIDESSLDDRYKNNNFYSGENGKLWKDNSFEWQYYKAFLPISELYHYGLDINISENEEEQETKYKINIGNPTYKPVVYMSNGTILKDWGPCTNEKGQAAQESARANWSYYSYTTKPDWKGIAISGALALLLPGTGLNVISPAIFKTYRTEWEVSSEVELGIEGNSSLYFKFYGLGWRNKLDYTNAVFTKSESSADEIVNNLNVWYSYLNSLNILNDENYKVQITNNQKWMKNNLSIDLENSSPKDKIPQTINLYQYFNFYKDVALSYSYKYNNDPTNEVNSLYVKNKYLKILKSTDNINLSNEYLQIPLQEDMLTTWEDGYERTTNPYIYYKEISDDSIQINLENKFSSIKWYPIKQLGKKLQLSSILPDRDNSITLEEAVKLSMPNLVYNRDYKWYTLFNPKGEEIGSVLKIKLQNDSQNTNYTECYYMFCKEENYGTLNITNLNNQDANNTILWKDINTYLIYDNKTDMLVDPLKENNIINIINEYIPTISNIANASLYIISETDLDFKPVEDKEDFNKSFYKKIGEKYERLYTKEQAKDLVENNILKVYSLKGSNASVIKYEEGITRFELPIYLCSGFVDDNGNFNLKSKLYNKSLPIDFTLNSSTGIILDENNISYNYNFNLECETLVENLGNLSNGDMWYKYNSKVEWPIIFEAAASIETQLEIYWQQALTASKYCKYFLPDHWQPKIDAKTNAFSDEILISNNGNITLSSKYLPIVNMFIDTENENKNMHFKHKLPKYNWYYSTDTISIEEISSDILNEQSNLNYLSASSINTITKNPGINDVFNTLKTDINKWKVTENGYTTYYYNVNGGMLWKDLANELGSYSFDRFSGLYAMYYDIITSSYSDWNLDNYKNALLEKQKIWKDIYDTYPFVMLEDNYSYSLATNSDELLKMAKLVFKGKKEPEKNYSIGLIDINALKGYKGQELFPGQSILLNVNEYYDRNDDVYSAINQYLFITDISYSLRDDSNINITVNNIKYQEKLLQSLVKLIR